MANLIHCQNRYQCFEALIEFLLSLFYLFYLIICYRILSKDKSGVLVQIDKYLCFAALIETLLQTIYYLYFDNDFLLSTIRCLGIAIQITFCNILGSIVVDEIQTPRIWQLARALLGCLFILWYWFGIAHRSLIDYNCVQADYLILSSIGLIFAGGSFYLGIFALSNMQARKNSLEVSRSGFIQVQSNNQKYEQVLMRIKQITLMHYCGLIQFGVQFSFDLFTYINCQNSKECRNYYNATTFFSVKFIKQIVRFFI
ncbi:unnamed protein product [Paramecium sonneborni]|uniref:Transmembrane protein n=1 Tax=Paramecium sonneborni TaxID=65129 RepID=A0A8S1N517_9CILI|nr:unnamed protein product [Paramecium sonneborni]CAD8085211.1 unnamed protein product [Paramecium sonneborni]